MYKVLNVNQTDNILGGSDVYWQELSNLLVTEGNEVINFSSSKKNKSLPSDTDFNKPSLKGLVKFHYNYEAKKKLDEIIQKHRVSVAHLNIYYGKLTTSILDCLVKKNIPIIQTLHEYKLSCPVYTMYRNGVTCFKCQNNRYYNSVLNLCNKGSFVKSLISMTEQYYSRCNGSMSKVDHFICVSNYQRNQLIEMGEPSEKLTTIHNFVNYKAYEPVAFTGDYFLYFGRIEEVKGIHVLLEAIQLIYNKYNLQIPVKIVGDGQFTNYCKDFCNKENLNFVDFLGHQNKQRITELINNSIASIVPSLWGETFGLTIVETMALQRPVIISKIGGMTEIVEENVTGLVFEPGNHAELAEKILFLHDNLDIAQLYGINGRRRVIEHFSPESYYRKLDKLYQKVINGSSN